MLCQNGGTGSPAAFRRTHNGKLVNAYAITNRALPSLLNSVELLLCTAGTADANAAARSAGVPNALSPAAVSDVTEANNADDLDPAAAVLLFIGVRV